VAAIVPEPPDVLRAFAQAHGVTALTLLSDEDAAIIRRLGLQDTTFSGKRTVPYAGSFMLDAQGRIQSKFFEADTENRRTAGSILAEQGEPGVGGQQAAAPHFTVNTSVSNAAIALGQRLTLIVDVEMKPGFHAYAPGAAPYRALDVKLDQSPLFAAHETRVPPGKPLPMGASGETVPVLEGHIRVLKDVTQQFRAAMPQLQAQPELKVAITGTLEYQVCSARVCYPPASMPLRWELTLTRWTR
jgi:cytochrome c biogenesis DsbD-like protein